MGGFFQSNVGRVENAPQLLRQDESAPLPDTTQAQLKPDEQIDKSCEEGVEYGFKLSSCYHLFQSRIAIYA